MKLIRTIYTLGLLVGLFASCSKESPLDGEFNHYKTSLYCRLPMKWYMQFDVAYGDWSTKCVCCRCLREVARISTGMWKSS